MIGCETVKEAIGVLANEVAGLMSKVVNLWNYLSDREIHRLREEIVSSVGAKRLVAEDHDYLMDLALSEILENFRLIAKSVVWLGRKCKDPHFLLLELPFLFCSNAIFNTSFGGYSTGTSGSTSGRAAEKYKISKKQPQPHHQSSSLHGKQSLLKTKGLSHAGPFKECMMSGSDSPVLLTCNSVVGGSFRLTSDYMKKT
uniref:DUF3475 domain-containing protein n=1 Tax=Salix viminalis TaxID=40686 RepID=A0A6N2LYF0_SALVM